MADPSASWAQPPLPPDQRDNIFKTSSDAQSDGKTPLKELPSSDGAAVPADLPYVDDKQRAKQAKADRIAKYSSFFTVLASGCALISDGYQNNSMTLTNPLLTKRYGSHVYTSTISTRVSNALLVGAILGQLTVGVVTDRIGRKSAIVITTVILCLGAIFATAASPIHGNPNNLFWWLIVARGAIGFGVGGEYPASSVSAGEAADERYSSKAQRDSIFIWVTNVVLTFGGPLASSVFLIVLSATGYGETHTPRGASDMRKLDITWRICFGIGALLPMTVFYFRWRMINSKLYRKNAIKHNVPYLLALRKYWPRLFGISMAWFLYDFVAFANGVFSGTVISLILKDPPLRKTGEYQLLLGALSLPGAFLGPMILPYTGTKWLLVFGFGGYVILGVIIGAAWNKLTTAPAAMVVLYGLLASFGNLGPGSCCGLVSAQAFPTALRGTHYGFAAAFAKAGAAIGTECFHPIQQRWGKNATFYWAAGIGAVGVLISAILVPDTTKIDLAEQDREWNEYLLAHGRHPTLGDGSGDKHALVDSEVQQQQQQQQQPSTADSNADYGADATTPAHLDAGRY